MVELGISTFGETTELEGTGQTYSHAERIRQLVAEIELADKVGLDVYGIGEHHRADFAVSAPEIVLAAWGSQYQENPFDQCSQHSLKYGPYSFIPTICDHRCIVKWTSGDYGWKGVFHGIFSLVWI